MEDLLIEQETVVKSITRIHESFKKRKSDGLSVDTIQDRREHLQGLWRRCETLDMKIHLAAKDSDKSLIEYFSNDCFITAEGLYFDILNKFNQLVSEVKSRDQSTPGTSSSSLNMTETSRFVKLPKIEIPQFSGDYIEWPNFRDIFHSLIVSNTNLHDAQKLHYLKSSLTDQAAQLVKHLSVTEANFSSAWEMLSKRYENKRVIINSLINKLLAIPSVQNDSVPEIKNLRDVTAEIVRALKNLDRDIENDLLVVLTVKKLSKFSLIEWEKQFGDSDDFPTYKQLDSFLSTRIRTLEAIQSSLGTFKNIDSRKNSNSNNNYPKKNQSNANSVKSFNITLSNYECCLCGEKHLLFRCDQFKSLPVIKRLEVVKRHKLCFNCLRQGHVVRKCTSKHDCMHCKQRHHSMLHRTRNPNKKDSQGETENEGLETSSSSSKRDDDDTRHSQSQNSSKN